MKRASVSIIVFTTLFILSCDGSGNVFLTNGYPYDVIVVGEYEYRGEILKKSMEFKPGDVYAPAGFGHVEYSNITSIKIQSRDETVLAEYTKEYLLKLRNVYRLKRNRPESWIFTEKGLFLGTIEIQRKFKFDSEEINRYYCSDEAVRELELLLQKMGK